MRIHRGVGVLAVVMAGALGVVHCGDDDSGSGPATGTGPEGSYTGVMVGDGFAAEVKISVASATTARPNTLRPLANGTVTVSGTITSAVLGVPITVTGTFDPATLSLTFSGSSPKGEISFRGKLENGVVSGPPATTPFGDVPLTLVKDLLGVKVYCGRITGGTTGLLGVFTAGDRAGAAYAVPGSRGAIAGTFAREQVDIQGGGAKVLGTVSGAILSGTFTSPGGVGATYSANEGSCATLAAEALDGGTDGGDGGGTDGGGTDGGPPGMPELVATVTSPGVGHMALSNGVLYYTIAHTYFSQKLEIGSVKTDGTGAATVLAVNTPPGETRNAAGGIAVAGGNVYVAGGTNPPGGDTTLYSVPIGGGALTTHGSAGPAGNMESYQLLVADAAGVYRADGAVSGAVRGFSLAGVAGGTISSLVAPAAIATDGTNVFFGGGDLTGIKRVPNTLSTGAATATEVAPPSDYKIGAFVPSMTGMITDATHVYWAGADNANKLGGVWRRPKDGSGATEKLIQTAALVRGGIAVDDTYVYFFTVTSAGQGASSGTLQRVAKSAQNGTSQTIGAANPYAVVSDGTYVYWGDGTNLRKSRK